MAYLVGSLVGGQAVAALFAQQDWSGFIGGLAAGTVAARGGPSSTWGSRPYWGAATGVGGGAATMAGDLLESALKRRYGVRMRAS
jgi:phosphatidate cytidylyltransferase